MTSAEPAPDTAVDYARRYAALGLRVLPIPPGQKRPRLAAWQDAATTDPTVIDSWWRDLYADHGIGLAPDRLPDGRWWFVVDIDQHGDDGHGAWHELQAAYGEAPATVEATTGGGGTHLLYAAPHEIRNANRLPAGIDVRGHGGQIVVEPSLHPSGQPYTWVDGQAPWEHDIADAPGWLLAHLVDDTAPQAPRPPTHDQGDRPGDIWAATTTWDELLAADGWQRARDGHEGEQRWVRPGKDRRDGISATVGYKGSDVLKVFTSAVPGLDAEQTYTKLGYWAATRHGGDHSAAASALRALGHHRSDVTLAQLAGERPVSGSERRGEAPETGNDDQAPVDPATPLAVRWVDKIHENPPPEPPELIEGFLRSGEFTVLGAPRAIGKTWLGYNLATVLARGEGRLFGRLEVRRPARVLYLQGELDEWASATRWAMLAGTEGLDGLAGNAAMPHVAESFERLRIQVFKARRTVPRTDGGTVTQEYADAQVPDRLIEAIDAHGIEVVVVDPWAVYFAGNENSNDEVEAALGRMREVTQATGVAWVILHHLSKATDYREPEDAWRGASRLADWASTRVTVLPHYAPSKAAELDLAPHEARRYVDVHFLRRSAPTPNFSMHLGPRGWWEHWDPDDTPTNITPTQQLAMRLHHDGGTWPSVKHVTSALGITLHAARKLVAEARDAGIITLVPGPNNSLSIHLNDIDRWHAAPWGQLEGPARDERAPRAHARSSRAVDNPADPNGDAENPRARGKRAREAPRALVSAGQSVIHSSARPSPPTGGTLRAGSTPPEGGSPEPIHATQHPAATPPGPDDDDPGWLFTTPADDHQEPA